MREVYLTPFYALSELGLDQRVAGAGQVRLARVFKRKTHYGQEPAAESLELDFNPAGLLLSEARFGAVDGGRTPVTIRYSDYMRVGGAAFPRRIERRVGDNPPQVFFDETISLGARLDEDAWRLGRDG